MRSMFVLKVVYMGSDSTCVTLTEEEGRAAIETWREAVEAPDGTGSKVLTVCGICDEATRCATELNFLVEEIRAMYLTDLSPQP